MDLETAIRLTRSMTTDDLPEDKAVALRIVADVAAMAAQRGKEELREMLAGINQETGAVVELPRVDGGAEKVAVHGTVPPCGPPVYVCASPDCVFGGYPVYSQSPECGVCGRELAKIGHLAPESTGGTEAPAVATHGAALTVERFATIMRAASSSAEWGSPWDAFRWAAELAEQPGLMDEMAKIDRDSERDE